MATVAFLVNELRERDPGLARKFEDQIQQAAADVEPGERLHCFIFIDPVAPAGSPAGLVRMRVGQIGWYRDFPPVAVDESPLAMGMAVSRLLRRHRRAHA
jgi:hypothetical protein